MSTNKHLATFNVGRAMLAATLALGIGVLPLAACGSQQQGSSEEATQGTEPVALDVSSWKTLGDGLATMTDTLSYGYDESYFVCVIRSGDSSVRAVCKADPSIDEKLADIGFDDPDYNEKITAALGDLELISAEDITNTQLSQEELDSYVGKTGQDMLDAGFVFAFYNMYGGEQTGADMDNGYYTYDVTFDVSITEDQVEDGGESLLGATVVEIQGFGNLSNMALDPSSVQ